LDLRNLNVEDVLEHGGELEAKVLNVVVGVSSVINDGVHKDEGVGVVGEVEQVHAVGQ